MTWRDTADILGNEARKLSLASKQDLSKPISFSGPKLVNAQAETRSAVNAAIEQFCRAGEWPALDPAALGMLVRRLLFAENLLRGVLLLRSKSGEPLVPCGPALGKPELLECLLTEAWERYGLLP